MKKILGIMTAFIVVAMFAAFGCQKQEGQKKTEPGSAPTSTAPAAPSQEHK